LKKILKAKRGQFLVIAAFLVVIILTTTMITVYNGVQYNPFTEPATLANMITEINSSIKRILGFTVGYYGSILQVTGNYSYAQEKINNYIYSGITNVAHSHIEWSPSFEIDDLKIATKWFEPVSWSLGNISLTYSLPNQGLEGIQYTTSCLLLVDMKDTVNGHSIVNIRKEGYFPNLWLTKENFFFYSYDYDTFKWNLIPLENDPTVSIDGNYSLKIPSSVNHNAYFIKVVDDRGIMASAYYTPTRKSEYSYSFSWNNTLYQSLNTDTIVVELLQNGTLRWLNENLFMNGGERPIPPFPIHAIHVNQTVNGVNIEVPFQIEDCCF